MLDRELGTALPLLRPRLRSPHQSCLCLEIPSDSVMGGAKGSNRTTRDESDDDAS